MIRIVILIRRLYFDTDMTGSLILMSCYTEERQYRYYNSVMSRGFYVTLSLITVI